MVRVTSPTSPWATKMPATRPAAVPIAPSSSVSATTWPTIWPRVTPSERRVPIRRRRWITEKVMVLWIRNTPMTIASRPIARRLVRKAEVIRSAWRRRVSALSSVSPVGSAARRASARSGSSSRSMASSRPTRSNHSCAVAMSTTSRPSAAAAGPVSGSIRPMMRALRSPPAIDSPSRSPPSMPKRRAVTPASRAVPGSVRSRSSDSPSTSASRRAGPTEASGSMPSTRRVSPRASAKPSTSGALARMPCSIRSSR